MLPLIALTARQTTADAARELTTDTGTPVDPLEVGTLAALVGQNPHPILVGSGVVRVCEASHFDLDVFGATVAVQERILDGDDAGAIQLADSVLGVLACASGAFLVDDVVRLYYLRGIASMDSGDAGGAQFGFGAARALKPELRWDARTFGDQGADLFDLAAPPSARIRLRIVPTPDGPGLVVDGRAFPTGPDGEELAPGQHVVQLTSGTAAETAIVTADGDATLVLSRGLGDDALGWVWHADQQPALNSVLTALGADETRWIVLPESTWSRAGDRWELVAMRGPVPDPARPPDFSGLVVAPVLQHPWRDTGVGWVVVGELAGVVGSGLGVVGAALWPEDAPYYRHVSRRTTASALISLGLVVDGAAVGLVFTGVSKGLPAGAAVSRQP